MATVEEMRAEIAKTGKNKMERNVPFLRLILRSDDCGGGWRRVAPSLVTLTKAHALDLEKAVDLIEEADGSVRVRVTEFGHELLKFA